MLKLNGSSRLPFSRNRSSNNNPVDLSREKLEKVPKIIEFRSLQSAHNTSFFNSSESSSEQEFSQDHDHHVNNGVNPIDLSVSCSSKISLRTPSKLNPKLSLLPKLWHLCDLCDVNFSSKFALWDHFRRIHKIQRITRREKSPEVEIIPISIPGCGSPLQKSLAEDIIYHPPAMTIRRTSTSSSNSSNQESFVHPRQDPSSALFRQFDLMSEVCRICSASFADKRNLMSHMKSTHPMESRFGCTICSKVLSSRAALIGHMRIHTGEKPHVCSICSRAFSNSQTLTRHFRTHTKEKPYECPICGKRASLRHNMKLHIKIHEKQMMFVGPGQS